MSLVYTLDKHTFSNLFDQYGRSDQFSRCAREALFEYYDDEGTWGGDVNIDIVSICCDWSEYDNEDLLREYNSYLPDSVDSYESEDAAVSALIEALRDETTVIELGNGSTLVMAF